MLLETVGRTPPRDALLSFTGQFKNLSSRGVPRAHFYYTHSQPINTKPSLNRTGNLEGTFLPLRSALWNQSTTVHHYYWLLKISEVDESANYKETPMAGREIAKHTSVSTTPKAVILRTLGPTASPLWKLSVPSFQVLLPQTVSVTGLPCSPEVSIITSGKSQSDIKADAKIHADLSELIPDYHDNLYSRYLLGSEYFHANSKDVIAS